MSTPAITLSPDKTVLEAAATMLKNNIHRIPIINKEQRVVGIVTRGDIFQALEANVNWAKMLRDEVRRLTSKAAADLLP